MSMDWDQVDALFAELVAASKTFRDRYNSNAIASSLSGHDAFLAKTSIIPATTTGAGDELSAARKNVCGVLSRLHTTFAGPSSFILQLAAQVGSHHSYDRMSI